MFCCANPRKWTAKKNREYNTRGKNKYIKKVINKKKKKPSDSGTDEYVSDRLDMLLKRFNSVQKKKINK